MSVEPPLLVMLVGLPGSGKSAAAQRLAAAVLDLGRPCRIVGTDAYLEAEATRRGLAYASVFAERYDQAQAVMWGQVEEAIRTRTSVVWDQTNLTVDARRRRLILFPRWYLRVAAVMPTPDEVAWARNLARGPDRAVPKDDFDRMRARFRRPRREEGFRLFV